MIGRSLAHYRVVARLGAGGMGEVYAAEDTRLGRRVAIKLLPPELGADPARLERFEREARTVAALNHPAIVTLYAVEEAEGRRFLTMELVEGKTLAELLAHGPLSLDRFFAVAVPLADALAAAHEHGVVHRDLKPSNVMVAKDGRVKVLDFGLAKLREELRDGEGMERPTEALTGEGQVLGTVPYMAPEQLQGKPVDARADLFSLGVLLYQMATGRHPFPGDTSADVISSIMRDRPARVDALRDDLPGQLGRVLEHCLEKAPERRWQSARDLASALDDLQRGVERGELVTRSSLTGALPAQPPAAARWRRPALLGALALTGLVAAGLYLTLGRRDRAVPPPGEPKPSTGRPSLAVLYFDNLSGEPDLDWLRHGLTDMLVTDLAQSPSLEVLSTDRLYQILAQLHRQDERITSFEVVRDVAERADADTVLVGSFMRAGDTIRVNVKIQEAATGRILGTDRVEATGDEAIFAMVDDLTRNIRSHLELPAAGVEDRELADVSTDSLEAYRHYVEAMRLHDQLKEEEAGEVFLKATEVDPEFAMAWARLATTRGNLQRVEEARADSGRAMELLDRVTPWERFYIEAGHYSHWPATLERSIATYERALTQFPGDMTFLGNLGVKYGAVERFADAARIGRQLVERRDSFESTYGNLARVLVGLGELEEARRVMEDFLRRMPDSAEGQLALAQVLRSSNRPDEALAALARAEALRPGNGFQQMTSRDAYLLLEDWPQAAAMGRSLETQSNPLPRLQGARTPYLIAAYAGTPREALAAFERVLDEAPAGEIRSRNHTFVAAQWLSLGDPERARRQARLAAAEAPGSEAERSGLFHESLAELALGRREASEEALRRFVATDANFSGPSVRRSAAELEGRRALLAGDPSAAVRSLEEAASLLPAHSLFPGATHCGIWFHLGESLLAQGEEARAAEWFRRIDEQPSLRLAFPLLYVRALERLGSIHNSLGDRAAAAGYYSRFLAYWGEGEIDRDEVAQARRRLAELDRP